MSSETSRTETHFSPPEGAEKRASETTSVPPAESGELLARDTAETLDFSNIGPEDLDAFLSDIPGTERPLASNSPLQEAPVRKSNEYATPPPLPAAVFAQPEGEDILAEIRAELAAESAKPAESEADSIMAEVKKMIAEPTPDAKTEKIQKQAAVQNHEANIGEQRAVQTTSTPSLPEDKWADGQIHLNLEDFNKAEKIKDIQHNILDAYGVAVDETGDLIKTLNPFKNRKNRKNYEKHKQAIDGMIADMNAVGSAKQFELDSKKAREIASTTKKGALARGVGKVLAPLALALGLSHAAKVEAQHHQAEKDRDEIANVAKDLSDTVGKPGTVPFQSSETYPQFTFGDEDAAVTESNVDEVQRRYRDAQIRKNFQTIRETARASQDTDALLADAFTVNPHANRENGTLGIQDRLGTHDEGEKPAQLGRLDLRAKTGAGVITGEKSAEVPVGRTVMPPRVDKKAEMEHTFGEGEMKGTPGFDMTGFLKKNAGRIDDPSDLPPSSQEAIKQQRRLNNSE